VVVVEGTSFAIGAKVSCTDGACGRLTQVVINPLDERVTHLIVEPEHRQGLGRLVPIDWVRGGGDQVDLQRTKAEFEALDIAEENRFLLGREGTAGYDPEQALLWPYLGGNTTVPVTVDTLPVGEVAIRRDEPVHARDGEIGRVEGLVVDPRNHHVTHVLLQEGHLFGRKEVAIPLNAVTEVGDAGIRLAMSKQEVSDLPPVELGKAAD
jgi:sporulation protein YlmC with PRC-barrel domain